MKTYIAVYYRSGGGTIETSFETDDHDDAMAKANAYKLNLEAELGGEFEMIDFHESIPVEHYFSGTQIAKMLRVSRQRVMSIARAEGWSRRSIRIGSSMLYHVDDVKGYLTKRKLTFSEGRMR